MWVAISRTLPLNVIPVKLKVAINADTHGLYRRILGCDEGIRCTSYHCLRDTIFVLDQFDSWFWQTNWPPCMHILFALNSQVRITLRNSKKIILVKSGPLQCIHKLEITSTLYIRLLTQPYNWKMWVHWILQETFWVGVKFYATVPGNQGWQCSLKRSCNCCRRSSYSGTGS